MAAEQTPLSLDAIVRDVANQLHNLRKDPPKDPVIQFSGCEIELTVKATVEAGGAVRFYVFTAEGKATGEQTSKIKLTFGAAGQDIALI